jgi:hypothetical protein
MSGSELNLGGRNLPEAAWAAVAGADRLQFLAHAVAEHRGLLQGRSLLSGTRRPAHDDVGAHHVDAIAHRDGFSDAGTRGQHGARAD